MHMHLQLRHISLKGLHNIGHEIVDRRGDLKTTHLWLGCMGEGWACTPLVVCRLPLGALPLSTPSLAP